MKHMLFVKTPESLSFFSTLFSRAHVCSSHQRVDDQIHRRLSLSPRESWLNFLPLKRVQIAFELI